MKRDMELLRLILLKLEEVEPFQFVYGPPEVGGYEPLDVAYHVRLLFEAGFIGAQFSANDAGPPSIIISHLSWRGHEFLDAAREESRRRKAVAVVKEKAGAVTIGLLQEVLVGLAKRAIGMDGPPPP